MSRGKWGQFLSSFINKCVLICLATIILIHYVQDVHTTEVLHEKSYYGEGRYGVLRQGMEDQQPLLFLSNTISTSPEQEPSTTSRTTKPTPSSTSSPVMVLTEDPLNNLASDERGVLVSTALLVLLCTIIVSLFASHIAKSYNIQWAQSALISTCLGALLGALVKYAISNGQIMLDNILAFNEDVFFIALLPPIVFQSGFSLSGEKAENFLKNFGAILWFAIFATLVSFATSGALMFLAGVLRLSPALSLREAFAFGAVMSSTDPVAVLSMLESLAVHPSLLSVIAGESLMNDAFAIVLYRAVATVTHQTVLQCVQTFFGVFFSSIGIGVAVGLVSALIYKYMHLHKEANRLLESALLLVFPWVSYLTADGAEMSGIVAILFSGLTMSHYTLENLSSVGQKTCKNIFGSLALLAETTVFVLLGVALFASRHPSKFDWRLYVATLLVVSTSRAVSVYLTSFVVNLFRRRTKFSPVFQHVMCVCGVRGAVAFALALRSWKDFGDSAAGPLVLSATLFYAVFTIVVISLILPRLLLHWLQDVTLNSPGSTARQVYDETDSGSEDLTGQTTSSVFVAATEYHDLQKNSPLGSPIRSRAGWSDVIRSGGGRREASGDDRGDHYQPSMFNGVKTLFTKLDASFMKPFFTNVLVEDPAMKYYSTAGTASEPESRVVGQVEFSRFTRVRRGNSLCSSEY